MDKHVTVTAASIKSRWGCVDENLAEVVKAAQRAADDNSRLLLLPECCLTGADWPTGETRPSLEQVAVTLDSPPMLEVLRAARRTGVVIAVGLYEKRKGRICVTQAYAGPRGMIGAYRKVHQGGQSSFEKELFPVHDLGFVRVGCSICYDNMFPECARILALKGAELLLSPFTSLPLTRKAWRLERLVALRARAQDNRLFVLSVSHAQAHVAGKPSEWGYSGICCAINPLGEVIGMSGGRAGRPQRLTVTLDAAARRTYLLAHVPSMLARRAADYHELADAKLQRNYLKIATPLGDVYKANRNVTPA
ncbi:MAG: carbon-nitrogen hydrolase family protein [Phycisphaerae bacterium]